MSNAYSFVPQSRSVQYRQALASAMDHRFVDGSLREIERTNGHNGSTELHPSLVFNSDMLSDIPSRMISFKKNAGVFHQGSRISNFYLVRSGMARLFKTLSDGRRQIITFVSAGAFLDLNMDGSYNFSSESVTDTHLQSYKREDIQDYFAEKPDLLDHVFNILNAQMNRYQDHLVTMGTCFGRQKIARFILHMQALTSAHESLSVFVPLAMGRQDIGDYLGMTIESVSRLFNAMDRERLILIVPGGIRILNAKALMDLAQS